MREVALSSERRSISGTTAILCDFCVCDDDETVRDEGGRAMRSLEERSERWEREGASGSSLSSLDDVEERVLCGLELLRRSRSLSLSLSLSRSLSFGLSRSDESFLRRR
jgi:hypothetical protein